MDAFGQWRETVLGRIRFWPDRKTISQELTDHYQDHVRAEEMQGCPPEKARLLAVEALGDPAEVGRGLDRVHHPLLGWAWFFSRILVILCMVILGGVMFLGDGWQDLRDDIQGRRQADGPVFYLSQAEQNSLRQIAWARLPPPVERAGYDLSVTSAGLWTYTQEGGTPGYYLALCVTGEPERFWWNDEYGLNFSWAEITVSNGNAEETWFAQRDREEQTAGIYRLNSRRKGLTGREYWFGVYLPETVEWAELRYPLGEGFSFRLDFQEVDG